MDRSLFIEDNGLFNYLNVAFPRDGLASIARGIVAELDFLNMDLVGADVQKPAAWSDVLTADEIERMAGTWEPLKQKLLEDCKKAIAATDIASIEAAKSELAATLREIAAGVGPLNEQFLRAIAEKLTAIADEAKVRRTA